MTAAFFAFGLDGMYMVSVGTDTLLIRVMLSVVTLSSRLGEGLLFGTFSYKGITVWARRNPPGIRTSDSSITFFICILLVESFIHSMLFQCYDQVSAK